MVMWESIETSSCLASRIGRHCEKAAIPSLVAFEAFASCACTCRSVRL